MRFCTINWRKRLGCVLAAAVTLSLVRNNYSIVNTVYYREYARTSRQTTNTSGQLGIFKNISETEQMINVSRMEAKPTDPYKCSPDSLGTPQYLLSRNLSTFNITCAGIIAGDETVLTEAKRLMDKHPMENVSDESISLLTKNCEKFKSDRGYHLEPVSTEELEFPIAFNMLVHTSAYQVEILLRAIYRPHNQYCIHVDSKMSSSLKQAIWDLVRCFDNVFVASKLENVVYAGFSRLQADINCMKDHLNKTTHWKYLLNVAGQAFPIKTNRQMVEILKVYNGSNDIEGITGQRIQRFRFEKEWKEVDIESGDGRLIETGKKNPPAPYDINIVRGSAYGVFSRDFVHFIIHDKRAQALLEWSRNTWSPDEHYWATLHHTITNPQLHTPGGYIGKPDDKPWLAAWSAWAGLHKCYGKWVRGTCVFGVGDLPSLVHRHEFFVNKLYYNYHPIALECLNNWLEQRITCPSDIDRDFYNNLPFVKR